MFENEMGFNSICLHLAIGKKYLSDLSVFFYASYESYAKYTCKGQSCQLDIPRANFICVVK